ncbi:hypothetical protein H5410_041550 [Solanum commersonii]|uniref:DUF7746 domain-containing protein n=1 Tax=Solanum commersonii TaxID=4109 RepID=A0A9J5XUW3_SOLCO|nr:hypothetical protein H5410_041550 [Solanum commersonii]
MAIMSIILERLSNNLLDYPLARRELGQTRIVEVFINLARIVYTCKDRQIYITVHRMLMYNTICKANKNSNKIIADMITTDFTGHLKGWWDNYLNPEQRDKILQAVKQEGEQNLTQNVVYTLVFNIIEHFSGRWSDNSETLELCSKTLGARPSHLSDFIKMSSLAKLWSYQNLNQQVKRHRLNEREQLGEFREQFTLDILKASSKDKKKKRIEKKDRRAESYKEKKRFYKSRQKFNKSDTFHKFGRFGHYAKDCRVKEKIKNLDIDDNIKDSLCKSLLNSDSGKSKTEYNSHEESSTREDLQALHQEDYMSSDDDCLHCQQGLTCDNKEEEDDLYKIYSQFKELSINVINIDKVIELLQIIKEPEIRTQIIDKISDASTSQNHITKDVPTKEGSYTMTDVKNLLFERRKLIGSPTTISDLKQEINNLKDDIHRLKEKNVTIENRLDNIESHKNLDNSSESSYGDEVLTDEENIEIFDQNNKREVMLLREQSDLR